MARSFSNVKLISSFVADKVSVSLNRRGLATAAAKGASNNTAGGGKSKVVAKTTEEASSMWVPDPVTGCYRPENQAVQIDVAELRKRLLKKTLVTTSSN
ncbi:hypothetical protein QQ045_024513 [Rhodiola kirilowii]